MLKIPLLIFGMIFLPHSVWACGYCYSDSAAAVYSYKNQQLAEKAGDEYVVMEIKGDWGESQAALFKQTLEGIPGVVKGTVLISSAQKSVSFVRQKAMLEKTIDKQFLKQTGHALVGLPAQ